MSNSEGYKTAAIQAKNSGDFRAAARLFNSAKAKTIGHGKRDRLEGMRNMVLGYLPAKGRKEAEGYATDNDILLYLE